MFKGFLRVYLFKWLKLKHQINALGPGHTTWLCPHSLWRILAVVLQIIVRWPNVLLQDFLVESRMYGSIKDSRQSRSQTITPPPPTFLLSVVSGCITSNKLHFVNPQINSLEILEITEKLFGKSPSVIFLDAMFALCLFLLNQDLG